MPVTPSSFQIGTTTDSGYALFVELQNEKNKLKTDLVNLQEKQRKLRDAEAFARENGSFNDEDFREERMQLKTEESRYTEQNNILKERFHNYYHVYYGICKHHHSKYIVPKLD